MIKLLNDHIIKFMNIDETMSILRKNTLKLRDIPTKLLISRQLIALKAAYSVTMNIFRKNLFSF